MRQAHYWRKAGASSPPSNIIVFDCETWFGERAKCEGGEIQSLRLGVALAYRLEGGERTRIRKLVFRSADQFWKLVFERLDKRRPLWVFAHNTAYDLGCVGGWAWLANSGYKTQKAAVSGTLFSLKGRYKGCGLNFGDTINYFRCSLASLGKSVGRPKLPFPSVDDPDDIWERYCENDVEVTALGLDKLIAFGKLNRLGPWQPSIAGLSFAAFRSRFMSHKVLVHPYKRSLEVERRAYYGGIVDTPLVGRKIPGPIFELDVCSMYPHCCTLPLPTKIAGDGARYGPEKLRFFTQNFLVIADVTLYTTDEIYPCRGNRGTYYPTGGFRTSLAHPELTAALERGHIRYVHWLNYYESAPIFKEYMEWFVKHKIEYHNTGDDAFETLCKYYATNLYGKTGQRSPQWREWGRESLQVLEEIHSLPCGTLKPWYRTPPTLYDSEENYRFPMIGVPIDVRDYYGKVELKVAEGESRESCPAIAATVTSYARCLLRKYQRIAGAGNWFYSDTDSIWTNARGRDNLEREGCIADNRLGFLGVKSQSEWLVVHGPKDYETNLTVKMKGIRKDAARTDDGGFRQLQFPSAMTQIRDGLNGAVFVRHITKHLKRTLTRIKLLPSGETRPLVFPDENPERVTENLLNDPKRKNHRTPDASGGNRSRRHRRKIRNSNPAPDNPAH